MKLGMLIWKMQRYTAIYFLFFMIYTEYLFFQDELSFEFISNNHLFKLFLTFFIFLATLHGFAGMWTVGTDYLTSRTLGFLSPKLSRNATFIRKLYESFFFVLGSSVTIFYLLLIWL